MIQPPLPPHVYPISVCCSPDFCLLFSPLDLDLFLPILFCCSYSTCSSLFSGFSLVSYSSLFNLLLFWYQTYFQPPSLPLVYFHSYHLFFLFASPLPLEVCIFCSFYYYIIMYCFWIYSFSLSLHVLFFPNCLNPSPTDLVQKIMIGAI